MNKYYKAIKVLYRYYLQGEITHEEFEYLVKLIMSRYMENQLMEKYYSKLDKMMDKLLS